MPALLTGSTSQLSYRVKRLLSENHTLRMSLTTSTTSVIALAVVFVRLSKIAFAQSGGEEASIGQYAADEVSSYTTGVGKSVFEPCAGAASTTDGTPSNHTVQIEDETASDLATKLGRSTHESAASIDPLPRFYWASDNGTLATFVLSDPSKDPLDNLIRPLDAPDGVLVDGKGSVVAHGSLRDDEFNVFATYWELAKSGQSK